MTTQLISTNAALPATTPDEPVISPKDLTVELLSRVVAAAILIFTTWKVYGAFQEAPNITLLLALVGEVLTLGLVIFARLPKSVNSNPLIFIISFASSLYFLFVELSTEQTLQLIPIVAVVLLQLSGVTMQLGAKIWLGRSFGVLPADRGVVTSGPYRWVRHPIYFGYFLNHVGFFLFHASPRNAVIYTGLYAIQITRIVYEEKILIQDREYAEYTTSVRHRLIPYVF